jgi:phosphate-selective porin OprO and OprP
MSLILRSTAVGILSLVTGLAWAEAPTPDIAALLKRIEDQEKRIEALERRLQDQQTQPPQAASALPLPPPATLPGGVPPSPAPSSTATAGATAAVSGKAARAAETPIPSSPGIVRAGAAGFYLQSADGANVIRFRGNLAFDGRWFSDDSTPSSADTWLFRKVRPYIEGTLENIYDFRFMPDFAGGKSVIVDAFVTGRFKPWFALQAGKFKAPVGLERLQPDQFNRFLELGFPSELVPNRDLGVELGGDFSGGVLGYAIGSFDGTLDGSSSDSNPSPDKGNGGKRDVAGRLFAQPFVNSGLPYLRALGFGVGGTYVNVSGTPAAPLLPTYLTPGQQTFFTYRTGATATYADGQRSRWTPQFFYYVGSFGVLGEYVASRQDVSRQVSATLKRSGELDNSAWQLSLSYFLTGEAESYNNFVPRTTFELGAPGWGAFELVARYHELRIDRAAFAGGAASFADPTVSARLAQAFGVGLNWYLNQNVRWMFDYERTRFTGGAPSGDRHDEQAFLTRFLLNF